MCIYMNKMKPRVQLGITWSLEELKKLVNDKKSCVYMERSRKHVALHPIHLNDIKKAFQNLLDSSINFYDPQFKGLVLAYKNPKLISQLGSISYDSHFIHIDIEADFYIFRPEEQCVLTGVVNKKADNYIGALVHKVFNVSLPKKEEESWEGHRLEVGENVTFTIEHIDLKGKLPFIRGKRLFSETSTQNISSTAPSHKFYNSDEESDNDDTENASQKVKQPKRLSFLNTTNSDSSDEETQTANKVVKDKKHSKLVERRFQDEEEICKTESNLESTVTNDESEYDPNILNGIGNSKKSSKKDKKKTSKNKERCIEDENNISHDDTKFDQSENVSTIENETSTRKSKKRKHENSKESAFSESSLKIHKHKKKRMLESDEQSNISDKEERLVPEGNLIESDRVVEEETMRKSKKKHKEKIKVEHDDEQANLYEMEANSTSFNSDIDYSQNSTQEEHCAKSSKKRSKHKNKLKENIKEEQSDFSTNSDHKQEHDRTQEIEYEVNRTTRLLQNENQTDVSFHNNANNDKDSSQQNLNEFETSNKCSKKKKRSSTGVNFLAVKIKEEPVSDDESSFSKKSKRKRKDGENTHDSSNSLDTETSEVDSSQYRKNKDTEKEPVGDVSIGKITVKQEVMVKDESSKKKKHKDINQSSLSVKQESTFSDVEGTAVKKKIKTLFTE